MFPGLLVPIPDRGVVKMYEKRRLGCVFLAMIAWFRPLWHVPHSVNVARFHFSAVFWNRAASHTPVVAEKCRKTQFGGMKCVGKTHFGRKNVARFEICPENRNRATKFAVSFRDLLSLGRFSRYGVRYKLGVRTVGQEAQWRAQGLPIAIVEGLAFENGWVMRDQLMESAERYGKSPYGQHLKGIADGEIMLVPNQKN